MTCVDELWAKQWGCYSGFKQIIQWWHSLRIRQMLQQHITPICMYWYHWSAFLCHFNESGRKKRNLFVSTSGQNAADIWSVLEARDVWKVTLILNTNVILFSCVYRTTITYLLEWSSLHFKKLCDSEDFTTTTVHCCSCEILAITQLCSSGCQQTGFFPWSWLISFHPVGFDIAKPLDPKPVLLRSWLIPCHVEY